MRLCKDCKYVERKTRTIWYFFGEKVLADEPINSYARCKHPEFMSLVTGEGVDMCVMLRVGSTNKCGAAGKLWEPWDGKVTP